MLNKMIISWKHKGLKKFFETGSKSGINAQHAKRLKIILQLLHAAVSFDDLNIPGMNFHSLKGKLKSFFAVSVSGNWRVIYKFINSDAADVDYIDYH